MFKIETYNTLQGYNFQPSFFNLGFNTIRFASYKDKVSYDTCLNLFPVEFSVPILTFFVLKYSEPGNIKMLKISNFL